MTAARLAVLRHLPRATQHLTTRLRALISSAALGMPRAGDLSSMLGAQSVWSFRQELCPSHAGQAQHRSNRSHGLFWSKGRMDFQRHESLGAIPKNRNFVLVVDFR